MGDDVGARKLGEKLLMEVEVEDLSSVLKSVRELNLRRNESENNQTTSKCSFSGIPELDALIPSPSQPILELISPPAAHHPSGAGKTSLLYLIISHAILPFKFSSSIALGGQDAMVIIFDPLNHISVPRLAEVMLHHLSSRILAAGKTINAGLKAEMKSLVARCMLHVHIFRPQSWTSLLETLRALPDYLFDKERHESIHRRVHSIILEDIDTFASSIRSASNSNPNSYSNSTADPNPLSTASTRLTTHLHNLAARFENATILTSHSTSATAFRPALPTSWPLQRVPTGGPRAEGAVHSSVVVTRLAMRRVEVLKFAPAISVEEAEAERRQRWEVVSRGRFECWKVGVGVRDGEGFVFRVGGRGMVVVEREDG